MQGAMLAPRASKRTHNPSFSSSRLRASNLSESDPLLVMEVENSVDRSLVRLKRVAIARNRICNALEKAQCGVHVLVAMKRNEAARKKFRDCLAFSQAREYIAKAVL